MPTTGMPAAGQLARSHDPAAPIVIEERHTCLALQAVQTIHHALQVGSHDKRTIPSSAFLIDQTVFQPLLLLQLDRMQLLRTKHGVLQIACSTRWKEASRPTGP